MSKQTEAAALQALRDLNGGLMNDRQAAALLAAGRLLQSKSWLGGCRKIDPAPGETYPQAVARVIAELVDGDRDYLRKLVAWVLSYDRTPPTGGTGQRPA